MRDAKDDTEAHFPRLETSEYKITSPHDRNYNCVAWVFDDRGRWWEPAGGRGGFHWPSACDQDDDSLGAYEAMFREFGFVPCSDGSFAAGVEKLCIYADGDEFTHVAVQLDEGWWTSKLGQGNDISHRELEALCAGKPSPYGGEFVFMERPRVADPRPVSGLVLLG